MKCFKAFRIARRLVRADRHSVPEAAFFSRAAAGAV